MPKLCDIVKPGVPCKVRFHGTVYKWDGMMLSRSDSGELIKVSIASLFDNDWQLDEPTVESVLRERGYELCPSGRDFLIEPLTDQRPALRVFSDKKPVTSAQAVAICDFLDQYK